MSRIRFVVTMGVTLILLVVLASAGMAQDEEPRLNLQFQNETLGQVLQLLARGYGLEYTLGEGVDPDTRISASLVGVTVDQALRIMLEPNGLVAVNQDGRYIIRQRPQPTERDTGPTTVSPVAASGTRPTPPAPTRATTYTPGASVAASGSKEGEAQEEEEERIFELIWPRYIGAAMASLIFGGDVIYPDEAIDGGGGGGYGGSSYDSGSSWGGSDRGGSSRGSRGGDSSWGGSSDWGGGSSRSSRSSRSSSRNW